MKASGKKNHEGIAARLRAYRLKFELNQDKAADVFGIPFSTYKRYESGTNEPSSEALAGMTKAGMNVNWLLTNEGEMLLADTVPHSRYDLGEGNTGIKIDDPSSELKLLYGLNAKQQDARCIEIDESILVNCLEACRKSYGEDFESVDIDQQLGYACNLYNSLVRLSIAEGRTISDMKLLEPSVLTQFLKAFISLGWVRKFTPPNDPPNNFF